MHKTTPLKIFLFVLLLILVNELSSATLYWRPVLGATGNITWTNPLNWSTTTPAYTAASDFPGEADIAVFDGLDNSSSTMSWVYFTSTAAPKRHINGLIMQATYTGAINVSVAASLCVGAVGQINSGVGTLATLAGGTINGDTLATGRIWFYTENTNVSGNFVMNSRRVFSRIAGNFNMTGGTWNCTRLNTQWSRGTQFAAWTNFNPNISITAPAGSFICPPFSFVSFVANANNTPVTYNITSPNNLTVKKLMLGGIFTSTVTINGVTGNDSISVQDTLNFAGAGAGSNITINNIKIIVAKNIVMSNTVYTANPGGGTGRIILNGNTNQTITCNSATTFHFPSLEIRQSSSGSYTLGASLVVDNTFTMRSATLGNLAGFTFTLGLNVGSVGTLDRYFGWVYGGNFNRWFTSSTITIPSPAGLYPVGSASDYCPFWLGLSNFMTTGGSVNLNFNYVAGTTSSVFADASWLNTILAVSNSTWTISTAGGFNPNGNSVNIRYGGGTTSFGTNLLPEIGSSILGSAFADFSPATNSAVSFEGNRTGLSLAQFNGGSSQAFRLSTINTETSPLPVELITFTALPTSNDQVVCNWSTATETANDYFIVEKTIDGIIYETVSIVEGAGNSISLLNYSIIDENPYRGTSYYRLKQVDVDNNFKYSELVAVTFSGNEIVSIFPNPAVDAINYIIGSEEGGNITIYITDVLGRAVFEKEESFNIGTTQKSIDISTFSSGSYILKVNNQGNSSTYKQFVVKQF